MNRIQPHPEYRAKQRIAQTPKSMYVCFRVDVENKKMFIDPMSPKTRVFLAFFTSPSCHILYESYAPLHKIHIKDIGNIYVWYIVYFAYIISSFFYINVYILCSLLFSIIRHASTLVCYHCYAIFYI